jgi:hypothetical protein
MKKVYIHLGEVPNEWIPLINKLSKTKDLINIMEKLELGDKNKITFAKLLK